MTTSSNNNFTLLFASIQNAKLASNAIQAHTQSALKTQDDLKNKIEAMQQEYNMLNDEVEILEMQKQHLIKAKEQTAITKDVNDFAFPVSDNDDNSSCVSHATPVSAKRTPNKKTTPARKSISSKRRQPTSPKKWRRMIRSQRLQSIFYA